MNFKKYCCFAIVLLFIMNGKTFSQNNVLVHGEELFYEVYYSFINIGWIKFYAERITGKTDTYKCYATLKSNDALPFVTVNYEFESEMTMRDNSIYPNRFTAKEYHENKMSILRYTFYYDSGFIRIHKTGFDNLTEYEKKQTINTNYQDGLSIFYYARYHSFGNGKNHVSLLINQDSTGMMINYPSQRESIELPETDYDISSVVINGSTDYQMVFGLTGKFQGWFSDDFAKIPLKAKMKVRIGNVLVELKSWKRKDWKPPNYK